MSSVNKVVLIGRLGKDPESRSFQSGGKSVSFTLATSEKWKDKSSGEWKEKTQWHNIVIFNDHIGQLAERQLKKGSRVYLEGQLETRKYTDQSGNDRIVTEIVLRQFKGEMTPLDARETTDSPRPSPAAQTAVDLDDEIPF